ncbi:antibiotic biosynthesis monooxygenase family protein [Chengkuizengella sediminis]|uniref:antibiotic biosynthesis monooxygenase family protein n=1 Tax=Chengkuizengella sediminis TaxID=1885917 RepID=UPI00138A34D7|nr:antibiotic biosynthesis monooxygenase [Chengkuizengella sediminis]NDI33883.1 antibiotic biosynthesis monooxygenase [Chengkuizengella sediminis]
MILEAVMLNVISDQTEQFEMSFKEASNIISKMKGYISHDLHCCIEVDNKYLLLVKWQTLEDHTVGFRESEEYLEWKKILHHYYDPFPVVEHFEKINLK